MCQFLGEVTVDECPSTVDKLQTTVDVHQTTVDEHQASVDRHWTAVDGQGVRLHEYSCNVDISKNFFGELRNV